VSGCRHASSTRGPSRRGRTLVVEGAARSARLEDDPSAPKGDQHDPAPAPQSVGVGFGSYVLESGKSILLTEELTAQMISAGLVKNSGTFSPSWLGVPLRTASRIIGVLAVQHYDSKDAYTETDLQFLDSVGSQIAMAIERKRIEQALFAANKRALADYESLVERIAATAGAVAAALRRLRPCFSFCGDRPARLSQPLEWLEPDTPAIATLILAGLLRRRPAIVRRRTPDIGAGTTALPRPVIARWWRC